MPILGSGCFQDVVVAGPWNDPKRLRPLRRREELLSKPQWDHFVAISVDEKLGHANPANLGKRVEAPDE